MLTIFAVPKPFKDKHVSIIQENAITSWTKLPICEIILMGNDHGVDKISQKLSIKHISKINVNEYGTPLLDSIFNNAIEHATGDFLAYVNADIILLPDFIESVNRVIKEMSGKPFLIAGRRWNCDIKKPINFTDNYWTDTITSIQKKQGMGLVIVSHNPRILDFIKPDKIHIMSKGKIVAQGGSEILKKIEKDGFGSFIKNPKKTGK